MVRPSVFLFLGKDAYSKEAAVREIGSSLGASPQHFDSRVFYGQDSEIDEILGCLATVPFLAPRRIVVIKDCEKLPKEARLRLAKYISRPFMSSLLVLESGDDHPADEYGRMARYIDIRNFNGPGEADFPGWIRQFLRSRNKEIDAEALSDLAEGRGEDILALSQELEKLATFVGERKRITSDDIESLAGGNPATSAFELAEAIDRGDEARAMRIVSRLTAAGKRHHEIVGLLCWHLRRLLKAKALTLKGEIRSRIADSLKIGPGYRDDFFRQLGTLSLSKIRSRLKMLLEADLDIKRTKFDPGLVLEFAVMRLCLG